MKRMMDIIRTSKLYIGRRVVFVWLPPEAAKSDQRPSRGGVALHPDTVRLVITTLHIIADPTQAAMADLCPTN